MSVGSERIASQPLRGLARSMVLASLGAPRLGLYIVQDVCHIAGDIDVPRLHEAWRCLSVRYGALRSSILFNGGDPVGLQQTPGLEAAWEVVSEPCELATFLQSDRERGFDFATEVPVRITVIPQAGGCAVICTCHHALLDGRSLTQLWRDWLRMYAAGPSHPPTTDRDLDRASAAERNTGEGHSETFWRGYLGESAETTGYIVDRLGGAGAHSIDDDGVVRESRSLSPERTANLHDAASRCGVTVNTLVQAAWAFVLSRYSGREDVVFGVTRARGSDIREPGFHMSTLPMRVRVPTNEPVADWLRYVRSQWQALRPVEHTDLEQIARWWNLPAGAPPFDSLINYDHEPPSEALCNLPGPWECIRLDRLQRTDTVLTLVAYGSPVVRLELVLNQRALERPTMSRRTLLAALDDIETVLGSFVALPEAPVAQLLRSPQDNRDASIRTSGIADVPPTTVNEIFERQVEKTPGHIALESPQRTVTYDDLNRESNRLARHIRRLGAVPDDFVAVCMPASPAAAVAALAVLKSGAAFLPLDPSVPRDRLRSLLADARPKLVLCDDSSEAALRSASIDSSARAEILRVDTLARTLELDSAENLISAAGPDNLAYAVYTSGSTGQPKCALLTHRALTHHTLAAARAYAISDTDRRLQLASIGSDVFVAELFNYLCHGAALVFGWKRGAGGIRDFLRCLTEQRITITGMPGAWWKEWMAAVDQVEMPTPPSLRAVIAGMEKLDPHAFGIWTKRLGQRIRLFNAYGPTETSPTATVYEAGSSAWESDAYVPIGEPIGATRVYVLDRFGTPLPDGIAGEIYIGGPGVGRGYLGQPELTAQRFLPDPFSHATSNSTAPALLYRTGDLGFRLPDANFVFAGRTDRQVKLRGYRVELEEIESALSSHAEIAQCAALVSGSEGHQDLLAFVVFRASSACSVEELRAYIARRLPEHMMPASLVALPEMPLTPSGKIDRRALLTVDVPRHANPARFDPPSTETERKLACICAEILGVSAIGASDNLFDLGADSLRVTRLITQIDRQLGRQLSPATLSRAPTIARLAVLLDQPQSQSRLVPEISDSPVVPLQPHGTKLPFFCFPGADDDPNYLRQLARAVGTEHPFYVVRDPRPTHERGFYTVEAVAERLLGHIQAVQPSGPYVLGGHCYGGLVAIEMARQLQAHGERVATVILIEAPAPGYPKVLRNWQKYVRHAFLILRGKRRVRFVAIRDHVLVVRSLLKRNLVRRRAIARTSGAGRFESPNAVPAAPVPPSEPAVHPNTLAGRSYAPQPLACDVVQIVAADEFHSTEVLDDPLLGWRDLVRGSFTVCKSPGKAAEIFRAPWVSDLGMNVRRLLDSVDAQPPATQQRI